MAFERLQSLGEEKFRMLTNELLRGTPCMTMARKLQQEWGDFQEVAEKTLTQQLNRLRQHIAEGEFGKAAAKQLEKGNTPRIKLIEGSTLVCMAELTELVGVQKARIQMLWDQEKDSKKVNTSLNVIINDTSKLIQDIQKIRFDLGLDEYKGVLTGLRGGTASVTLPDGTHIQKQFFEAVNTVEQVFERRGIPQVTDARI